MKTIWYMNMEVVKDGDQYVFDGKTYSTYEAVIAAAIAKNNQKKSRLAADMAAKVRELRVTGRIIGDAAMDAAKEAADAGLVWSKHIAGKIGQKLINLSK